MSRNSESPSAAAIAALVVCRGLKRSYGSGRGVTQALDGIDLEVGRGEILALVGPSGSGKSTLLHLIGAMDRADEGTVEVGGFELGALDDAAAARYRRESVGFVFQFFELIPTLSSLDNVALPARLTGLSAGVAREKARSLLERVGLGGREHDTPDALSGGQQQRLAIARALVNGPRLVLADEPTGALDRATGETVLALLHQVVREEGTTLILATHDEAVWRSASRVVRLLDGRIVADEVGSSPR